jgi:hypothetical protein
VHAGKSPAYAYTRSYLINGSRGVSGALRRNLNIGSRLLDAGLVWACGVLYHLRDIYEIASRHARNTDAYNVPDSVITRSRGAQ